MRIVLILLHLCTYGGSRSDNISCLSFYIAGRCFKLLRFEFFATQFSEAGEADKALLRTFSQQHQFPLRFVVCMLFFYLRTAN